MHPNTVINPNMRNKITKLTSGNLFVAINSFSTLLIKHTQHLYPTTKLIVIQYWLLNKSYTEWFTNLYKFMSLFLRSFPDRNVIIYIGMILKGYRAMDVCSNACWHVHITLNQTRTSESYLQHERTSTFLLSSEHINWKQPQE